MRDYREDWANAEFLFDEIDEMIVKALTHCEASPSSRTTIRNHVSAICRLAAKLHEENKELREKLKASNSPELPDSSTGVPA